MLNYGNGDWCRKDMTNHDVRAGNVRRQWWWHDES